MNSKYPLSIIFISSVIFTLLFYNNALGLNLLFYEVAVFVVLFLTKQFRPGNINGYTISVLYFISAFGTVVSHSLFAYVINFILFGVFIGYTSYPYARSFITSLNIAIVNTLNAQTAFVRHLAQERLKGGSFFGFIWQLRITAIPLIIITVFVLLYKLSNPIFSNLVNTTLNYINECFYNLFYNIDVDIIGVFCAGLVINIFIWFNIGNNRLIDIDKNAPVVLLRQRVKNVFKGVPTALKNEYKAAVFLLATLNIVILILNIIDIKWIWFRSTWEKHYLMQFVHEGTYLLILSILISVAIVLYYFRRNLNFYSNNKWLKVLSYIWLAQNGVMVLSVAIRNYRYIEYFALAYKRIGVFVFLLLVLYGLYTVLLKVKYRKTAFYLFTTNAKALLIVLVLASVLNWDVLIAKYNFSHADKASIHLNFMVSLSDNALHELDRPLEEVERMNIFDKGEYRYYLNPEEYCNNVYYRKLRFKVKWEKKNWLEWNWAEYVAYSKLK
jgi:Domain of unknown function (DUF4173)